MVVRRPDVICLLYVALMLINYEELAYLGEHLGVNFKYFCRINCCAIPGFPILRKALSTHVKNTIISGLFDIANQLLTRHSPLHATP